MTTQEFTRKVYESFARMACVTPDEAKEMGANEFKARRSEVRKAGVRETVRP